MKTEKESHNLSDQIKAKFGFYRFVKSVKEFAKMVLAEDGVDISQSAAHLVSIPKKKPVSKITFHSRKLLDSAV